MIGEPEGRGIYYADCGECDYSYIGETGNFLSTRRKQHSYNGAIKDHVKKCKHSFESFDWKMLKFEPDPNLRRIHESMFIKEKKHALNLLNNCDGVQPFVFP